MEQSVECKAEDIQAPSGDDDVSGMSVITIESTSPASVHSDDLSVNDMDHYMVDIDNINAGNEEVASSKNSAADTKPPDLDVIQCNSAKEEIDSEANVTSETDSKEVTDDINECNSALCKTSSPENSQENSATAAEDIPSFHSGESSDICDNGIEMASGNTTTLESGIILQPFDADCVNYFPYFRSKLCNFS